MKNALIILICKLISNISQLLNLGSGSTWPGHIALILNKQFIEQVIDNNKNLKIIVIAGQTERRLRLPYSNSSWKNPQKVFTNSEGANLLNGVASTIIKQGDLFFKIEI